MDDAKAAAASAQPFNLPIDAQPAWTHGASAGAAFARGWMILFEIPSLILGATGAGFGALAHDAGMSFGHASFLSLVLYATPAQVVLIDQVARGASLLGAAFAVTLTAIRLLPMMVTLMPMLRGPGTKRWHYIAAAHVMAITSWTEAFRRLPMLPPHLRMPHFLGLGSALLTALLIGTMIGYELAGVVPQLLTSALLFMMPLYFVMAQLLSARLLIDRAALGAGFILGPVMFIAAPGFDLLLTGLIGGTLAFLIGHRGKASGQ